MKKMLMVIVLLLISVVSNAQVSYSSSWSISNSNKYEFKIEEKLITISEEEIIISDFIGNFSLKVNKIINKDWGVDGIRKTYYCTTKNRDSIYGYQKVIIYIKFDSMIMAVFNNEINVVIYEYNIKMN